MQRRAVLSAVGTTLAATVAGCLGAGGRARSSTTTDATPTAGADTETATATPTTTAAVDPSEHTVAVTRRVEHGATGLSRVLRASEGGDLDFELACPDGPTKTATATVPDDQWTAFEARVLTADVTAFADRYDCEAGCPSDVPPTRVTFDVDGRVTEVVVQANADVPDALAGILDALDAFADRLDRPTCS